MLDVVAQQLRILELHQLKLVEHIRGVVVLLLQNELELVDELDFNPVPVVPDEGDMRDIARLCGELGLLGVQRVPPRRQLVAVLRVEELRVALVEIVHEEVIRDVGKVQKLVHLWMLLDDGIEVYADLLRDRVLCTCIVQ